MPEELATLHESTNTGDQPAADDVPPESAKAGETPAGDGDKRDEASGVTPPPPEAPPTANEENPEPEDKPEPPAPNNKHWYVVKVQSGREESIKEAIERRVKIEGLEEFFGKIIIPVERVTEVRNGKRVVKERKLYPGYLMVNVEYNDRILYLFRETSGVGDFVGGSLTHPPQPMKPEEVERMERRQGEVGPDTKVPAKSRFDRGDRVKVK